MGRKIKSLCPDCGAQLKCYHNPTPTVDIIITVEEGGIVLIMRRNEPVGWAIPGGFVDYGESLEDAAVREAREETSLDVILEGQLGTYSRPDRDPRQHTISTVFMASSAGTPAAADDAAQIGVFTEDTLPEPLMFDHREILSDYFRVTREKR
ncbi:MAG: NUDIX hydrolase [Syntrophobacterales bacterium]|nr:MAG: NUDIX hydrolase [Syntrophobacterales bacterium]